MLFLIFQLGADRYAIEVSTIVKVLPLQVMASAKTVPGAPPWLVGVLAGAAADPADGLPASTPAPVPVIDLPARALGRAALHHMSTRVVVVNYPLGPTRSAALGLIVERATRTLRLDPASFVELGVGTPQAPYLGAVTVAPPSVGATAAAIQGAPDVPTATAAGRLIQRVTLAALLPDDVKALLFPQQERA